MLGLPQVAPASVPGTLVFDLYAGVLPVLAGGLYKRSFIGGYGNKKSFAPERATGTSQAFIASRSPFPSEKYC